MIKRKIEQQKQKAAATTKPSNGFLSYLEQNQLTTMAYKALLNLAANRLSDVLSHYFSVCPLSFSHPGLLLLPSTHQNTPQGLFPLPGLLPLIATWLVPFHYSFVGYAFSEHLLL